MWPGELGEEWGSRPTTGCVGPDVPHDGLRREWPDCGRAPLPDGLAVEIAAARDASDVSVIFFFFGLGHRVIGFEQSESCSRGTKATATDGRAGDAAQCPATARRPGSVHGAARLAVWPPRYSKLHEFGAAEDNVVRSCNRSMRRRATWEQGRAVRDHSKRATLRRSRRRAGVDDVRQPTSPAARTSPFRRPDSC